MLLQPSGWGEGKAGEEGGSEEKDAELVGFFRVYFQFQTPKGSTSWESGRVFNPFQADSQ